MSETRAEIGHSEIFESLRKAFPHGHPRFYEITYRLMQLHNDKNYDYARGGDPLGNFNRVGEFLHHYEGLNLSDPCVVALVYMMKQVDAVFWSLSAGGQNIAEGRGSRFGDISVYATLARILDEERDNGPEYPMDGSDARGPAPKLGGSQGCSCKRESPAPVEEKVAWKGYTFSDPIKVR